MSLTPEERRERVERTRQAARDLQTIENAVSHLLGVLPAIQRELERIRTTIEDALAPPKPDPLDPEGGQ